jgi:nitroreductase
MDAIECLKTRRSVRSYKTDPIDRAVIEDIVDCGRLAATGMNLQPWEFVVITDPDMRRQVADITEYGKFIADAPCCIAIICENVKYFIEDGSAATQNVLLAARAHGLASCWVAGDKKPYARRIADMLGVPETHGLMSLVAIGHSDQTPTPSKRSLQDVLHWEKF